MYCPVCLPDGPRDAASLDPKTGKIVKASVEDRYRCETHRESAQLEPKNNGYYLCHCGWTNQPGESGYKKAKAKEG